LSLVDGGVTEPVGHLADVDAAARHLVEHGREGGEEGAAAVLDGGEEGGGGDGGAADGVVAGDAQELAGARLRGRDEALGLAALDGGGAGVGGVEGVDGVEGVEPEIIVHDRDELLLAKLGCGARGGGGAQ
jgi:hypothetical protein